MCVCVCSYPWIVKVSDGRLGEDAGEQGGNVGRVTGKKDDAETAPDVDEELIGPRFRCLEGHQVAEQQTPHDPQGGSEAKVFRPLTTPRIQLKNKKKSKIKSKF